MKCQFCSEFIEIDCNFCTNCGNKLTKEPPPNQLDTQTKDAKSLLNNDHGEINMNASNEINNLNLTQLFARRNNVVRKISELNKKAEDLAYRMRLQKEHYDENQAGALISESNVLRSMNDEEKSILNKIDLEIANKIEKLTYQENAHESLGKKYYWAGGGFGLMIFVLPFLPYSAPTITLTLCGLFAVAGAALGKLSEKERDEAAKMRLMKTGESYEDASNLIKGIRKKIRQEQAQEKAEKARLEAQQDSLAKKIANELNKK